MWNMNDKYLCSGDDDKSCMSSLLDLACDAFRMKVNCRTTVAAPLNVILKSPNIEYRAICVWDTSLSEIRLAFVFLSLIISYVGYKAFTEENKAKIDIFLYCSMFLIILLFINGFFDIVQILDSKTDNEKLCDGKGSSLLESFIGFISFECSFSLYYVIATLTFVTAILLLISAHVSNKLRIVLPKISDNL